MLPFTQGKLQSTQSRPVLLFKKQKQSILLDLKFHFHLMACSRLNHVAAGLVSPSLKSDTSSKEIEEAMKRVREAQSLISAAIEPGN